MVRRRRWRVSDRPVVTCEPPTVMNYENGLYFNTATRQLDYTFYPPESTSLSHDQEDDTLTRLLL